MSKLPNLAALAALCGILAVPAAAQYSIESIGITDLGTFPASSYSRLESEAFDINNHGDIVGWSIAASNKQLAVVWVNGVVQSLHEGGLGSGWEYATAYGINDVREIVGESDPDDSGYIHYPIYAQVGQTMQNFPHRNPWPARDYRWLAGARAINNLGRVAGWGRRTPQSDDEPEPDLDGDCFSQLPLTWATWTHAPHPTFCLKKTVMVGPTPRVYDINDSGNLVGTDARTSPHGMFLRRDGIRIPVPPPAGMSTEVLGYKLTGRARGINEQNWVVGSFGYFGGKDHLRSHGAESSQNIQAFFWDGIVTSASLGLGKLPDGKYSEAYEINEQMMVAGMADRSYPVTLRDGSTANSYAAFIWHPDFGMRQLPALKGTFYPSRTPLGTTFVPYSCGANSLNNLTRKGVVQVVGWCTVQLGETRSYDLTHAVRWDIVIDDNPFSH